MRTLMRWLRRPPLQPRYTKLEKQLTLAGLERALARAEQKAADAAFHDRDACSGCRAAEQERRAAQ